MTKEITTDDWKLVDEIAEEVLEDFLSHKNAELDKFEDFIVNPKKLILHYYNYNSEHNCKFQEAIRGNGIKRCLLENEIKSIIYNWFDERYEDIRTEAEVKYYEQQE